MRRSRKERAPVWSVIAVVGVVAVAVGSHGHARAVAEPPPAFAMAPLPPDLDSLTSLGDAVTQIAECSRDCSGIVYFWSPRMPLSRRGIVEVAGAAEGLGIRLALVSSEDLYDYAARGVGVGAMPLADAMLRAGVLAHAPALVVHDGGELVGHAILGYKNSETYQGMIARRLSGELSGVGTTSLRTPEQVPVGADRGRPLVDYDAVGTPGAYFRWVPGRQALAYESGQRVYLLDLADGESRVAPGYIDFVPTPDGRYFVTPGPGDGGLSFYEADEVFDAARRIRSRAVEPIFTDRRMRDQYPSVGILEDEESRTVYRVLTSWFEGIIYRDYEVRVDPRTGASNVRPLGEPVVPCSGMSLSTPIMSQDGLEVAARDEATGTTKIFRIRPRGRCDELEDLGVRTSKVAWHRTGRRLVFATPRVRSGRGGGGEGIFLFDRDEGRMTRIADSERASLLAFPDFIGDESVVFLIPGASRREGSVFRVVDEIR